MCALSQIVINLCYSACFVLNLVGMYICRILLSVSGHVTSYDNSKMILPQYFSSS